MGFFTKSDSKVCLLIDIGSGSITTSYVLYERGKHLVFLHTLSREFTIADKPTSFKLVENMSNTLDSLLLDMSKNGFSHKYFKSNSKNISQVVMSFSSPWFMPKTKHVEIIKEKAFTITDSFINDLVSKEEEVFKKEIMSEHDSDGNDTFEVVENSIVHIKVNGYALKSISGHKTNSLDAYLCMSVISGGVLERVYSLILKHTHISRENILIHTFPVVSFSVLRDLFSQTRDFIILDATSEVTDITLVQGDIIVNTASIPTGKNFIVRQIAREFKVSVEIAESTLALYIAEKLDKVTADKMEKVITEIEKEWAVYFEKALLDLSQQLSLPQKLYITSDYESSKIYSMFVKLPKADVTALFRKNVDVLHVENKVLNNFYVNDSITIPNEFIVILAIFYQKIVF